MSSKWYVWLLWTLVITTFFLCSSEDMDLVRVYDNSTTPYITNRPLQKNARWQSIAGAVRSKVKYDGIDVIIPMGTAIENARLTNLCIATELTRDGTHLSFGTARYVASCVWVGALFTPVFGCHLSDIKTNHVLEEWEIGGNEEVSLIPGSSVAVTDDNRKICIRCAEEALKNPFTIIDVKSEK